MGRENRLLNHQHAEMIIKTNDAGKSKEDRSKSIFHQPWVPIPPQKNTMNPFAESFMPKSALYRPIQYTGHIKKRVSNLEKRTTIPLNPNARIFNPILEENSESHLLNENHSSLTSFFEGGVAFADGSADSVECDSTMGTCQSDEQELLNAPFENLFNVSPCVLNLSTPDVSLDLSDLFPNPCFENPDLNADAIVTIHEESGNPPPPLIFFRI